MFNGALEKLEHLRQDITHEFGTSLGKFWHNFFLGSKAKVLLVGNGDQQAIRLPMLGHKKWPNNKYCDKVSRNVLSFFGKG